MHHSGPFTLTLKVQNIVWVCMYVCVCVCGGGGGGVRGEEEGLKTAKMQVSENSA